MPGRRFSKICLAVGITGPSKHTAIGGRCLCGGVGRRMDQGFNDARQIDPQTLQDYVGHLRKQVEQGELAIATAQNPLSSYS
jgi:hypothetical protein